MKRVLIISDNEELARCFLEEFGRPGLREEASAEIRYSARNRDPSALVELGGRPIDLRLDAEVTEALEHHAVVISAHCKQIFPPRLLEGARCVNFHPGYNPFNRGWYPQVFSILNGDPLGVTVHEMTEEIDGGPIIAREAVPLFPHDTSLSAYRRVIELEKRMIHEWLPAVVRGDYRAEAPTEGGNYNSIADHRALCALDLGHHGTLAEHLTLLRALSHAPFRNAWFLDPEGRKVYVRVELERD